MSLNVLLVEDEPLIRIDVQKTIVQMGHKVVGETASGEEAIELAERLRPEIIVMDIGLSGKMDGIEAATIISKKCDATIIFLTGNSDEDSLMRATRNVRPYAYLIKPFDRDEFRRTFAVALARREEDADELPLIKDEWPKELSADGEESISQLMKFQSFAKLSKDAVRTLFEHSQIEELDSGKFFLNYVDSYDPYIPISGRLAVIESPSDGKELISNLLVAGDSFGFLPLESNFYSTRIVRAQLDSKVMVFSRSVYESVLEKNAALKTNLIIDLSNRLSSAYAFEASLAHVRVEARIVTSLLGLIPKLGKDSAGKKEIRLFLTRKELADLIGTTVETAIRLTKHLEREGYLDLTRAGIIKILDVEKLQALESNR